MPLSDFPICWSLGTSQRTCVVMAACFPLCSLCTSTACTNVVRRTILLLPWLHLWLHPPLWEFAWRETCLRLSTGWTCVVSSMTAGVCACVCVRACMCVYVCVSVCLSVCVPVSALFIPESHPLAFDRMANLLGYGRELKGQLIFDLHHHDDLMMCKKSCEGCKLYSIATWHSHIELQWLS